MLLQIANCVDPDQTTSVGAFCQGQHYSFIHSREVKDFTLCCTCACYFAQHVLKSLNQHENRTKYSIILIYRSRCRQAVTVLMQK